MIALGVLLVATPASAATPQAWLRALCELPPTLSQSAFTSDHLDLPPLQPDVEGTDHIPDKPHVVEIAPKQVFVDGLLAEGGKLPEGHLVLAIPPDLPASRPLDLLFDATLDPSIPATADVPLVKRLRPRTVWLLYAVPDPPTLEASSGGVTSTWDDLSEDTAALAAAWKTVTRRCGSAPRQAAEAPEGHRCGPLADAVTTALRSKRCAKMKTDLLAAAAATVHAPLPPRPVVLREVVLDRQRGERIFVPPDASWGNLDGLLRTDAHNRADWRVAPTSGVISAPFVSLQQLTVRANPAPKLPPSTRLASPQVVCRVELAVDVQGQPTVLDVLCPPALDAPVRAAMARWRFDPWLVDGQPVPIRTRVELVVRAP